MPSLGKLRCLLKSSQASAGDSLGLEPGSMWLAGLAGLGMLLQQHYRLLTVKFCTLHDPVSLVVLLSLIFSLLIGLFLYQTIAQ